MKFITNGPDIPGRLLQAHEEGELVFFCGAGISYPAGLPGFAELVENLYAALAISPNPIQQAAIEAGQYDIAVGLLEGEIVDGRNQVRRALADILVPNLSAPNATRTHEALLTLAKGRNGRTRLITTNFDRVFAEVIAKRQILVRCYEAPLLPVPKDRWDGLVYLHGLLGSELHPDELDRLVISSGDFGLAYLIERWAARFVSELFRNYSVCFVGYRLNDPVLRYMTDALAADRERGESRPEMYAFGCYDQGQESNVAAEWSAKGVIPILYQAHHHHAYLHRSLHAWADTYRDGIRGKERIVMECAACHPQVSTEQDDFVGRLLWAISDPAGKPAAYFADMEPVPALAWLGPLSEGRYGHADLGSFGIQPHAGSAHTPAFSLIARPTPHDLAPLMTLVDAGARGSGWDKVMPHLARWLTRHLADPDLLLWLAHRGGQMHASLMRLIENRLEELDKLDCEGNSADVARSCASTPNLILCPPMRTLWRLILAGRITGPRRDFDLFHWRGRFRREGLSASLRFELRHALTPCVVLRKPAPQWAGASASAPSDPKKIKDLVEWEIVLQAAYVHSSLSDLAADSQWLDVLPDLLDDFNALLRDTLDLKRELGGIQDRSDLSYLYQPSISAHPQNGNYYDWTALIDLTRDAWLATAAQSPERARHVAELWWLAPYPLFRRLALFAATQGAVIPPQCALEWLLTDEGWWLWSDETQREALRSLATLAPQLDGSLRLALEGAILAGPPRAMRNDAIDPARWTQVVEHAVWQRLAKLAKAGADLGEAARQRLMEITDRYPGWHLPDDERDEFSVWMGDTLEWHKPIPTPHRRHELVDWLRAHPERDMWRDDQWRQRCHENFAATACALCYLANEGDWVTARWKEALSVWSEGKHLKRSWRYLAPLLVEIPETEFRAVGGSLSWWLYALAGIVADQEALFFNLIERLLRLDDEEEGETDDPLLRAINHPLGQATQALLRWWQRHVLVDDQGLPDRIKPTLTTLCDPRIPRYRHGRVVLAGHLIILFRVDRVWTTQYLLPLFDWNASTAEARVAWKGFLSAPRPYHPLISALKPAFLATADHYAMLGNHGENYAALLTLMALNPADTFTDPELAKATAALPPAGLAHTAQALVRALDSAGDLRKEFWTHRVAPYLHAIWPKSRAHLAPAIASIFGHLCVAAHDAFPDAVSRLKGWLQPLDHPEYLIHRLHASGLCSKFPESALDFLSQVITQVTRWPPDKLGACLRQIEDANPMLKGDPRIGQLIEM